MMLILQAHISAFFVPVLFFGIGMWVIPNMMRGAAQRKNVVISIAVVMLIVISLAEAIALLAGTLYTFAEGLPYEINGQWKTQTGTIIEWKQKSSLRHWATVSIESDGINAQVVLLNATETDTPVGTRIQFKIKESGDDDAYLTGRYIAEKESWENISVEFPEAERQAESYKWFWILYCSELIVLMIITFFRYKKGKLFALTASSLLLLITALITSAVHSVSLAFLFTLQSTKAAELVNSAKVTALISLFACLWIDFVFLLMVRRQGRVAKKLNG